MRKWIVMFVIFAMLLPIFGCGASNPSGTAGNLQQNPTVQTTNLPPTQPATVPPATTVPNDPTQPTQSTQPPQSTEPTKPVDPNRPTIPAEPTAAEDLIGERKDDVLLYIPRIWCVAMSSLRGVPIQVEVNEELYPGMEITFEVRASYGELWKGNERGKSVMQKNNYCVYWTDYDSNVQNALAEDGALFVDVIVRADGYIIGYGICEIGSADGFYFAHSRCEAVIFPVVDGRLQYVSEDYVLDQLAQEKCTVTPFDLEAKKVEEEAYIQALREADEARKASLQWTALPDSVQIVGAPWWDARKKDPGIGLQISLPEDLYPGKQITYKVYVYGGVFLQEKSDGKGYEDIGRNIEVQANQLIYWGDPVGPDYVPPIDTVMGHDGVIFIEIKYYADGQIVGFSVVEIGCSEGWLYFPVRNETFCCLPVEGKLQPLQIQDITLYLIYYEQVLTPYDSQEKMDEYEAYLNETP